MERYPEKWNEKNRESLFAGKTAFLLENFDIKLEVDNVLNLIPLGHFASSVRSWRTGSPHGSYPEYGLRGWKNSIACKNGTIHFFPDSSVLKCRFLYFELDNQGGKRLSEP